MWKACQFFTAVLESALAVLVDTVNPVSFQEISESKLQGMEMNTNTIKLLLLGSGESGRVITANFSNFIKAAF